MAEQRKGLGRLGGGQGAFTGPVHRIAARLDDRYELVAGALSASPDTSAQTLAEAVGLFQKLGKQVSVIGDVPGMIVARTVAMLIDLAADAVAKGAATAEDIDTATVRT
mgnify:CR=1 FL=1